MIKTIGLIFWCHYCVFFFFFLLIDEYAQKKKRVDTWATKTYSKSKSNVRSIRDKFHFDYILLPEVILIDRIRRKSTSKSLVPDLRYINI